MKGYTRHELDGGKRIVIRGRSPNIAHALVDSTFLIEMCPENYYPKRVTVTKREDGSSCRVEVYFQRQLGGNY